MLLAFLPYGLMLLMLRRSAGPPDRVIIGFAVGLYAALLIVPPPGSQDAFSYLFYGRMLAHGGVNPHAFSPAAMSGDPWFPFVQWQDTASVYGPVWTYTNALVAGAAGARLWPALVAIKALSAGGAIAGSVFAGRLVAPERRRWLLIALLANPLVLFSVAVDGHVDGALLGLLAGALLARHRGRTATATLLLTAATLVKLTFGLFLALHVAELILAGKRRRAALEGLGAAVLVAAAYAPVWGGGKALSALTDVGSRFSATFPRELERVTSEGVARGVSVAIFLVILAIAVELLRRRRPTEAWTLAFAGYLLATPWFLPWHAIPLLVVAIVAWRSPVATPLATGLAAGALVLSASVLFAVPLVRFGIPVVVAFAAARLARARVTQEPVSVPASTR